MIKINENYAIDVDRYNYILVKNEHRKDKNGKDVYKTIGYYNNIKAAFSACAEWCAVENLTNDEFSLKEAVKIIQNTYDEFKKLLEEVVCGD